MSSPPSASVQDTHHVVAMALQAQQAEPLTRQGRTDEDFVRPDDVAILSSSGRGPPLRAHALPGAVWQLIGAIREGGEYDNRVMNDRALQFGYYVLMYADFQYDGTVEVMNVQGGTKWTFADEHGRVDLAVGLAPALPSGFHAVYTLKWKPKAGFGELSGIVCEVQGTVVAATFAGHIPSWIARSITANSSDPDADML